MTTESTEYPLTDTFTAYGDYVLGTEVEPSSVTPSGIHIPESASGSGFRVVLVESSDIGGIVKGDYLLTSRYDTLMSTCAEGKTWIAVAKDKIIGHRLGGV